MKPTEDLVREHYAIKTMLGIMQKISEKISNDRVVDTDDVENIIDFLQTFADKCHHGKEENVLFPALVTAGIPNESGPVGVMLHEHVDGRRFISNMVSSTKDYKTGNKDSMLLIADNFTNYIHLLQNHIQKEENILFKMADKVLSSQVQDELLEKFGKIEEEIIGHGVHEHYHRLLEQLKTKYSD